MRLSGAEVHLRKGRYGPIGIAGPGRLSARIRLSWPLTGGRGTAEISPVHDPLGSQWQFWAPSRTNRRSAMARTS
jgi:hypothetical protein